MSGAARILIGVDPSDECDDAIALGGLLCEPLEARPRLLLAHVSGQGLLDRVDFEHLVTAGAERRLHIARTRLRPLDAETVAVASDSPAEALDHDARDCGASTIVVGSSRRTGRGRVTPGGVGESLLHAAPCAIAIAPRGFARRESNRVRRVAAAFDGSEESWRALDAAARLAAHAGGSLTVLTVLERGTSPGRPDVSERDRRRDTLDIALERIAPECRAEGRLLEGEPGPAIAAASADSDLLVLGSRGYGPLRRALLGGVSAKVLRAARCPVLIHPRGEAGSPAGSGRAGWSSVPGERAA